ncbi:MAG: VWA domain-containing protein [Sphingomonadales bacterium]
MADSSAGKLAANIMHFARVLRAAGLRIGTGTVIEAVRSVEAIGVERRDDLYWTLHATFITRHDQHEIFDQAFHLFWRDPKLLERMMGVLLPRVADRGAPEKDAAIIRRLAEALGGTGRTRTPGHTKTVEIDAALTASDTEILQHRDFEQMSGDELAQAKAAIARMNLSVKPVPTRRYLAAAQGRKADIRASLRAARRYGGGFIPLRKRARAVRPPPLVLLCDISGSMQRYSRMLLHFMHRLTNDRDRVSSFLFGTRLTNVTRHLRYRDVDMALARIAGSVEDWSGGTRIGRCLHRFNRDWARRVLGQGAVVLLISDGLDRDAGAGLSREMDRLHRSCRRLIWLNPLLRYPGFEPKSLGIKAILPHVDDFRPVHNLRSLGGLVQALSHPAPGETGSVRIYQDRLRETAA